MAIEGYTTAAGCHDEREVLEDARKFVPPPDAGRDTLNRPQRMTARAAPPATDVTNSTSRGALQHDGVGRNKIRALGGSEKERHPPAVRKYVTGRDETVLRAAPKEQRRGCGEHGPGRRDDGAHVVHRAGRVRQKLVDSLAHEWCRHDESPRADTALVLTTRRMRRVSRACGVGVGMRTLLQDREVR